MTDHTAVARVIRDAADVIRGHGRTRGRWRTGHRVCVLEAIRMVAPTAQTGRDAGKYLQQTIDVFCGERRRLRRHLGANIHQFNDAVTNTGVILAWMDRTAAWLEDHANRVPDMFPVEWVGVTA